MKENTSNVKTKKGIMVLRLFLISVIFIVIAASIAVIGCNYIENRNFKELFYNVSSLKVNNKIRVIQISDLHSCSYGTDNSKIADRVKKLKPDIIIYTGDIIDSTADFNNRGLNLCKKLSKIAPSYFIYGNNEVEKYYGYPLNKEALDKKFGFNDKNRDPAKLLDKKDEFENKLEAAGVKVLKNEKDVLTIGTTQVDVYGVLTSNPSAFWLYAGESFRDFVSANENNLKIMAVHEPMIFSEFEPETWGDLAIAGHTHGGMVRVPMLGPLYTKEGGLLPERLGYYTYGRCEVQGRPLIISSGLDNNNLLRINNQPELVIIDINKF